MLGLNWLDTITLLSYVAIGVDMLLQAHRIVRTKSSHDVSLLGCSIRYIALTIILVKFISLGDIPLLIGQLFIVTVFTVYVTLVVVYARHPKPKRRAR